MAELLNFRRGELAGLKNITPSASTVGTVYVTTDEQAMYIDTYVKNKETQVDEIKRIRLSDIIQIDSYAQWQQMPPPYSSSALYYIIEQNALLKYTGNGTTHSWKQINSTSDIQTDLTSLTTKVNTNTAAITTLNGELGDKTNPGTGTIRKRLNDIEAEQIQQNTRLTDVEEVASNAKNTANAAKEAIGTDGSGASATGTLYQRIAQNKTDIATNTSSITSINAKVGNITDTSDNKSTAFGRIKALEEANSNDDSRLDALETAVGDKSQSASSSGSLFQRVKKNAADIETLDSKVDTNTDDIANIKGDITDIGQTNTAQQTSIEGLRTDLGVNDKTGTTAFARIKALETASSNQGDDVEELKDAVEDLQDKNDTQDGLINGNATAITNLGNTVNTLSGTVDTHGTDIGNLKTRMTTAEGEIDGLQSATSNLRADLGTKPTGSKTAFEEIAQNRTDIGNLNTSFTTLNNTVKDHTTTLGEHAEDIGKLKTAVGTDDDTANADGTLYQRIKKNANDISALGTRVTANEGNISKNTTDIETLRGNITTLNSELALKASKTDLADAKDELLDEINDKIVAANAMEFKGTVSEYVDLPVVADKVKIGDTYVASLDFYFPAPNNNIKVEAGDLLVANGTEDATTGLISGAITWEIVNTGYVQAHESKLVHDQDDTTKEYLNAIGLRSYTGSALGRATFVGEGAAKVTVSHSGSNPNASTVTVSLEWDTF